MYSIVMDKIIVVAELYHACRWWNMPTLFEVGTLSFSVFDACVVTLSVNGKVTDTTVWKNFDCVSRPEVTLYSWQDVKMQELSN